MRRGRTFAQNLCLCYPHQWMLVQVNITQLCEREKIMVLCAIHAEPVPQTFRTGHSLAIRVRPQDMISTGAQQPPAEYHGYIGPRWTQLLQYGC